MSDAWESPALRAFAGRLVQLRSRTGAVGARAQGHPSRGERALAFCERLARASAKEGVQRRFEWSQLEREQIPSKVRKGMNEAQKPFHLWNVERIDESGPYRMVPGPRYVVGEATQDLAPRGMPKGVETSTRALRAWLEGQEMEELRQRMNERRFRELLRQPLPYGRSEDEPAGSPAGGRDDDGFSGGFNGGFSGGFGGPPQGASGGFSGGFGGPPSGAPPSGLPSLPPGFLDDDGPGAGPPPQPLPKVPEGFFDDDDGPGLAPPPPPLPKVPEGFFDDDDGPGLAPPPPPLPKVPEGFFDDDDGPGLAPPPPPLPKVPEGFFDDEPSGRGDSLGGPPPGDSEPPRDLPRLPPGFLDD